MTNDLHMKILLCECKMSFKIGSLSFVKYIDKKSTYYPLHLPSPPHPSSTVILSVGIRKGITRNESLGVLKGSFEIFALGAYCISCQKRL